jgi:hypothetical protein
VATAYPNTIDNNITLPQAIDLVTPVKGEVVNQLRDAIIAIEAELGVNPSREFGTLRERIDVLSRIISQERIYGVIGEQNTNQSAGYKTIGAITINSNDYVSDATFVFQSIIETTNTSISAEIRLFNSTTSTPVSNTYLSSNSLVPVVVESAFEVESGSNIYLIQLKASSVGTDSDFVSCKNSLVLVETLNTWLYL